MEQGLIVRCVLSGLLVTSTSCALDHAADTSEDELRSDGESAIANRNEEVDAGAPWKGSAPDGGKGPRPPRPAPEGPDDLDDAVVPSSDDASTDGECAQGKPDEEPAPVGSTPDAGKPRPEYCTSIGVGLPDRCLSFADAKLKVARACEDEGLELVELTQRDSDGCEVGSARQSWGTCCLLSAPQDLSCWSDYLDGGKVCLDATDIKLRSAKACAASHAALTSLSLESEGCESGLARAFFQCCVSADDVTLAEDPSWM